MKRRFWTKDETTFLKENFSKMWVNDIAICLDRSESSVHHKAQRLGLIHGRWWTEKEIEYVAQNYQKLSKKQIAEHVDKTITAIESLGAKLGVTNKNFYPEERYCQDCGKKLANKYMKPKWCADCAPKHRCGENNPMWAGGVTKLYSIVQRGIWATWKFPILERDEFECQKCGYHGKDLEVHHIRRYADIRDSIISKNPSLSIEKWKDRNVLAKLIIEDHRINEGVTLCKSCHKSIHSEQSGELLETPNTSGEDNQQPSQSNVIDFVGWKVQRLTGEDSQPITPTRAPDALSRKCDDIV